MNPKDVFSTQDLRLLKRWQAKDTGPVTLTVRTAAGAQSDTLTAYANALAEHLPAVSVKRKSADLDTDPPALMVTGRLHYLAVPVGPELPPFLEALLGGCRALPALSETTRQRLGALTLPARLEVFISPHCPFCPATVSAMIPMALADGPQTVAVVDGALFPDLAAARDIRTAPTVVLDGAFRWSGKADPEEVAAVMADRAPSQLGADTLRGIIEDGMAADVAKMMADHGGVFDNLMPLLAHDKWPVRLGAMVVMENFQEMRPDLAADAADAVWRLMETAPQAVHGDLLHVIGETGDSRHEARLTALLVTELPPDVAEAAEDALAEIRERFSSQP